MWDAVRQRAVGGPTNDRMAGLPWPFAIRAQAHAQARVRSASARVLRIADLDERLESENRATLFLGAEVGDHLVEHHECGKQNRGRSCPGFCLVKELRRAGLAKNECRAYVFESSVGEISEMKKCSCGMALCVGVCLCGVALVSAEAFEYSRPSGPACFSPPMYRDFGPPAGCDNDMSPHNRTVFMHSLGATGTSSIVLVSTPVVAYTARDAEDAAETNGPGFEVVVWKP